MKPIYSAQIFLGIASLGIQMLEDGNYKIFATCFLILTLINLCIEYRNSVKEGKK